MINPTREEPIPIPRTQEPDLLVRLGLDEITFDPKMTNIRGANEGEALGDRTQLRASLRAEGQRVPLLIRVVEQADRTLFYVVDGFRRLACLRELVAGDSETPGDPRFKEALCLVREGTTADALVWNAVAGYAEPVPPFRLAERVHALYAAGMTTREITTRLSVELRVAQYAIKVISSISPAVKEAAQARKVSYQLVRELSEHDQITQDALLATAISATEDLDGVSETKAARAACAAVRAKLEELQKKAAAPVAPKPKPEPEENERRSSEEGSGDPAPVKVRDASSATDVPPDKKRPEITETELRKRVAAAAEIAALINSPDRDDLDLVKSLQTPVDGLNQEGAAIEGWVAGWCACLMYLAAETCPDCQAPMVVLPKGKHGGLPQEHVHD